MRPSHNFTAIIILFTFCCMFNSCKKDKSLDDGATINYDETANIIYDAYIYAYPLISMKITADVATNIVQTTDKGFAPYNQFSHRHTIPDSTFTNVVSPNVDTFYSSAWLDLDEGPMVLYLPDATLYAPEGQPWRYYIMQLMDCWSNVFEAPGIRTTTASANTFLITGPNWSGIVPGEMTHYASPTRLVWLLGRTLVENSDDIPTVEAFQNAISLMPLSAWPGPYNPPNGTFNDSIDMEITAVQVANMAVEKYFQMLCDLMVENPPASYDSAMIKEMAKVGIAPGAKFELSNFSTSEQDAIQAGYASAMAALPYLDQNIPQYNVNGWEYMMKDMGNYGNDYDLRAYIALVGLGANLAADAVYPRVDVDKANNPLNNNNEYTITFPAGQTPPANGFWSITMYDATNNLLVPNLIGRYAIGSYFDLKLNADSSLTIYVQKNSPGADKESNWLPASLDNNSAFDLIMRIYWPDTLALDNEWEVPGVVKFN